MKYHYVQVFKVSGISLPEGIDNLGIIEDSVNGIDAFLTKKPEKYCFNLNRASALATMMLLTGLVKQGEDNICKERLQKEIKTIESDLQNKYNNSLVLLSKITGASVNPDFSQPHKDFGDFIVSFGSVNDEIKEIIKNKSKELLDPIISSLFITAEYLIINLIDSGIYFEEEDGKIIYSFSLELSGTGYRETIGDCKLINNVNDYNNKIKGSKLNSRITPLITQAIMEENNALRAFIFSWTALEVFVDEIFKEYAENDSFFLLNELQKKIITRVFNNSNNDSDFLNNLKLKKRKFYLGEKFILLSLYISQATTEKDIKSFTNIKEIRNNISHGTPVDETALPTNETILLLKQYLRCYYKK